MRSLKITKFHLIGLCLIAATLAYIPVLGLKSPRVPGEFRVNGKKYTINYIEYDPYNEHAIHGKYTTERPATLTIIAEDKDHMSCRLKFTFNGVKELHTNDNFRISKKQKLRSATAEAYFEDVELGMHSSEDIGNPIGTVTISEINEKAIDGNFSINFPRQFKVLNQTEKEALKISAGKFHYQPRATEMVLLQ